MSREPARTETPAQLEQRLLAYLRWISVPGAAPPPPPNRPRRRPGQGAARPSQ